MNETLLPNRLCIERNSRFYSPAIAHLGVKIDGVERSDVVEFDVAGRWARIGVMGEDGYVKRVPGRVYDLQTEMQTGLKIEPYWKSEPSRQVRRAIARANG